MSCNYYSLLYLSDNGVYTSHVITISHFSDTRHVITTSYNISLVMSSTLVVQLHYYNVQIQGM
jgi:hypothetical protein